MPDVIEQMVSNRRLERVAPNPEHARTAVETAQRHIATAKVLANTDDVAMAFTAAYDAVRKAMAGVLAIKGLRARPVGGAHRNTGIAAAVFVDDPALDDFEWMRQVRNATEYPDVDRPSATAEDVSEAIPAAERIVTACSAYIAVASVAPAEGPEPAGDTSEPEE